jgi:menaquinone-dependent protoporphyrinogen oxidase
MVRFVRANRSELDPIPSAFLSVTLSQAGAQRPGESPERRRQFADDVDKMIGVFLKETGWSPKHILPVAGSLAYRRYNPIVRFIMKRIARKAGADTDTSRDYEYTDWIALDRFVDQIAVEIVCADLVPA